MMNNTYSMIINQSERAWCFQWARTLFALERRLAHKERLNYLRLYSINMVDPSSTKSETDNENNAEKLREGEKGECANQEPAQKFVPALMIIKKMNWTKAERRRLILGYWQVGFIETLALSRTLAN